MEGITVISNQVPRDVVEAFELSAAERAEFDYLDHLISHLWTPGAFTVAGGEES